MRIQNTAKEETCDRPRGRVPHARAAGFSTLELLIAFAVLTLSLSAVILVAFGNQSFAIDTELAHRALYLTEDSLDDVMALAVGSFADAESKSETVPGGIYTQTVAVTEISPCVKQVGSEASWVQGLRNLRANLGSIVVDTEASAALGHDCATTAPFGNWESPDSYPTVDVIHPGAQAYDVDVVKYQGYTFALLATSHSNGKNTFWILDVTDPNNLIVIGGYEADADYLSVDGLLDSTGNLQAFLASASSTAQLQVISADLSVYPDSNPTTALLSTHNLPGVSGSFPEGRVVTYHNNVVYLGTRETAGPEFHVFDVLNLATPNHLGSLSLNHSVREIAISGSYAYLAASAQTSAGCELIVLDISNPASLTNPCTSGSPAGEMNFRAPGTFDGTAISVLGSRVYLGRQRAGSSNDFYILDVSDLLSITELGSANLSLNANKAVVGVSVSADLAFIATSDTTPANGGGPFLVYDISDPAAPQLMSTCPLNFSEQSTAMDYLDNKIYIANSAQAALRIIYPSPTCNP